ncbi:MAG: flagellar motor switch protein FliN [Planctomycetota bacterium]
MADEDQNTPPNEGEDSPETPEQSPESTAEGESEGGASDAQSDAEAAMSDTQDKLDATADEAESTPPSGDEAEALAAVQAAIAGLSDDADGAAAGGVSEDASAADAAAEAAMMAMLEGEGGGGEPAIPDGAAPFDAPEFNRVPTAAHAAAIDLLGDVNLNVSIELGRTRMLVEDVLRLGDGAVVELDKLAGDPVDVFVNGRPVARGEVLVLNDTFCVRVNQILDAAADIAGEKGG